MTDDTNTVFHPMKLEGELPTQLNDPFDYEPHPLCVEASRLVCEHLQATPLWGEVMLGKMLGALVCQRSDGAVGFLAAYSGQLGGREDWPWFVPAVFDYLQPDGYFKAEEAHITAINTDIVRREQDDAFTGLKAALQHQQAQAEHEIAAFRQAMAEKKRRRDELRSMDVSGHRMDDEALIRESQFQKAELRRLKQRWRNSIAQTEELLRPLQDEVARLKQERHRRSDALQRWLFDHFVMLRAQGDSRTLTDIFAATPQRVPPAGTGECCAPKLLQYAFAHQLKPLCMAEFWQGASPKQEVRHHGCFYPACRGKCKPVLEWMLSGHGGDGTNKSYMSYESYKSYETYKTYEPHKTYETHKPYDESFIKVIFEDAALLVIEKPAGMLSVPGKTDDSSVESLLRQRYGEALMVHRLDQDTSGLMVVAKNREAHRLLQRQFHARVIYKMYIALLDGMVEGQGTVSLPLRPDVDDRPRQMVDYEHGKTAVTDYVVLGHEGGHTRVALTPHTGRTHQLRMHCAHQQGLGVPIVGDRLYGRGTEKGQRLCLHAAELAFQHPMTGEQMRFSSNVPF